MKATERFLKYITYATESREESPMDPSTKEQFVLAKALEEEMKAMGLSDVRSDDRCYVYGVLPATPGYEDKYAIGFIAHMDTVEDYGQKPTKAQIIEHYDGSDIPLGTSGKVLSMTNFPKLAELKGKTLITTDGTTPLGADDKAGIAEILTAVEKLMTENIPHGKVCIGFTPDEEIGRGALGFDVPGFGADFGYTVDSGTVGSLEYENFNASKAVFTCTGFSVHPGSSKNTMINAILVAHEIIASLPAYETPTHTEQYEGFFHVTGIKGDVNSARIDMIVRDHDANMFESRQRLLRHIEKNLNEKYGEGTVVLELHDQYRNMEEVVRPHMHLIENAKEAMRALGVEPIIKPIRGGTDGATLSYMGLPCPNMCAGGHAAHGPFEHVAAEDMELISDIIVNIVKRYAEQEK
ncbi:MAG: peptidase T [Clostridiales bacterium]|nr:peptidase T [Clostridiales bacterium]